ncbi:hypothetical protein G9A89_002663 [Geosiphon pyriformis]|nr:hypothetical protein G9A89_002663 [Geosiphon pyriformis]
MSKSSTKVSEYSSSICLKFIVKPSRASSSEASEKARRVFLNVDTMRQRNICTGDFVIIRKDAEISCEKFTVGMAWPSFTIQNNEIELSELTRENAKINLGDNALVDLIEPNLVNASKITLESLESGDFKIDPFLSIYIKETLVNLKYLFKTNIIEIQYHGQPRRFRVSNILPFHENFSQAPHPADNLYIIHSQTKISIIQNLHQDKSLSIGNSLMGQPIVGFGYKSVGGLSKEIQIIHNMVELPLKNPEVFSLYGVPSPKGILLYGPPGTGKTLIARAVAAETKVYHILINGPEIVSQFYGETEAKLRELFIEARENSPSIIFIDEIDALCSKRNEGGNDSDKRIVATLLTLIDGISNNFSHQDRIVVIGATNQPNNIDEALRRPGRFDKEVEIGIPNVDSRYSIISTILNQSLHNLSQTEIQQLAARSHGYVGADLAAVCREAGLKAIKRFVSAKQQNKLEITHQDMEFAMNAIRPSAMREILLEVPKVYWHDIGGQEQIKQKLKESIEWPLKHPIAFTKLSIDPPKGILLYGPPGCSKTLMAKALATEGGLNFIAVKGPELLSKWVGESEKAISEIFRKARAASPSIVFFDEIDALTVKRGTGHGNANVADRVLSQLLSEMDGIKPLINVIIVAATNRPDIMDKALLRPGRFDRILFVCPPDFKSRQEIFRIQLGRMACAIDVNIDELAEKTEGFSGAEVVALCQEAGLRAMEENLEATEVRHEHFLRAMSECIRRITPEMMNFYDKFRETSGLRSL